MTSFYTERMSPYNLHYLWVGLYGDQFPVGVIFSVPVQNKLGALATSSKMGTVSFPGVKRQGRGLNYSPNNGLDCTRIESRWRAIFSLPIQTRIVASCTMCTGSFPGFKPPRRGADHTLHLAPSLKREYN